ncbi:MAG: phenylalanine--tRNA ligase subunit beta, partial [Myxococcales bacterium]|nr:phenylalanine--tRNA ligase subunit beta [Myxococcales bacterium]
MLPQLAEESPSHVAEQLTTLGLEVEGLTSLSEALEGVVVGHVLQVAPHPKADRLKVTTVFDGREQHTVVCGAPNVAEDQKVAFATIGTTLPNGLSIEPRKIRGVASAGMLCAFSELGLSGDDAGIIVLPAATGVGCSVSEVLGRTDCILELGITPNRADAFSHLGVARDLAALNGYALPDIRSGVEHTHSSAASDQVRVTLHDKEGCTFYAARVLDGVQLGPSPAWVQDRLRALNQRPISNVVDATNMVLLECG